MSGKKVDKITYKIDEALLEKVNSYCKLNELDLNATLNELLSTGYKVVVMGSFLSLKRGNDTISKPIIQTGQVEPKKEEHLTETLVNSEEVEQIQVSKQIENVAQQPIQEPDKPKGVKITKKQS